MTHASSGTFVNVYVVSHCPLSPGDPVKALTTVVSPSPMPAAQLAEAVRQHNASPTLDVAHHVLAYPQMPPDPAVGLNMVKASYQNCARCHLSEERTRVVFFRGNPYAPVLAVGEGPGKTEDIQGVPFCGAGGRLQSQLLIESGIDPNQHIGWANLVGCRPCDNRFAKDRPPNLAEKAACSERTLLLLRSLRPRVVLCLGKQAAQMFWTKDEVDKLYPNTWHRLTPPDDPRDWVAVGYVRHPANLLRTIPNANAYREYIAALLFYESLRNWMVQGLEKVAQWRFGLRYLSEVSEMVVSGRC